MKIIAINGGPRKNWNTSTLLHKVLEGAASQNAQTEMIDLYDLDYKGCVSCFACKRKDFTHGKCFMKDGLSPLLEKVRGADALIFGSPIYFMHVTAEMTAFLERFFFSNSIYSMEIPTIFPKKIPSAFIYTMNVDEEGAAEYGLHQNLQAHQFVLETILGKKPELLYSYNTYQFDDYSLYESSVFSEEEKAKFKQEHYGEVCEAAYNLGVKIAQTK